MQVEASVRTMPVRWTDETFDFRHSAPLQKSYIIASVPRSGSQFLASELWKTGVLGAPCEYLFPAYDMRPMMNRLKAISPANYIEKLLGCRTSRNGVFGMNVHIQHFSAFLRGYPEVLDVLAPLAFVYTTRRNKIAQAVSMAKAYQTSAWTSQMKSSPSALYNRTLIETCLQDLEQQERDWEQWFASHNVTPFRVVYEDLIADRARIVQSIMELLGVEDDKPEDVELPSVDKQSDGTNKEWISRFEAETTRAEASGDCDKTSQAGGNIAAEIDGPANEKHATVLSSFAGMFSHYVDSLPAGNGPSAAYVDRIRSRQQFKVLVERNRTVFENARVLEFPSIDGRWGLAALDAGAVHFVGVEAMPRLAAKAARTFAEYGIGPDLYEFINAEVFSALANFVPKSFDLIMCVKFFERFDPHQLFRELHRLRPKYVILDTLVVPGRGPILRYGLRMANIPGPNVTRQDGSKGGIIATPSEALITFMCEFFGFHCHRIDWQSLGIDDWTGIHDYERGQRRTYLLECTDTYTNTPLNDLLA